jgi:3-oxoacyl-[acyl-carrier protein] reductase
MDLGIRGRRALVLGSSQGLGFGVAGALAAEGVDLVMSSRTAETLRASAGLLASTHGVRAEAVVCDFSSADEVEAMAQRALELFGGIDILVNNTGGPPAGDVTSVDMPTWYRQFDAMVMSLFRVTARLLPQMRARRWGRVLTIVSSSIIQPIPHLGISNTLRAALAAWSKSLSNEVAADGVTVNTVVAGRIRTQRVEELDRLTAQRQNKPYDEVVRHSQSLIPVGRYGTIEEFGAIAAFLASERAAYVTGAQVRVDGGLVRYPF